MKLINVDMRDLLGYDGQPRDLPIYMSLQFKLGLIMYLRQTIRHNALTTKEIA